MQYNTHQRINEEQLLEHCLKPAEVGKWQLDISA